MPITPFPQGISSFGMPVIGAGPILTTGNVFFVSSTAALASDGNLGTSPDAPLRTIDAAVGKCTANRGDHIIVMPGHVETVTAAGGLALDVAGITLVGVGYGAARPQINFTTAVGADMNVDAANITIINFLFTGGIDALTGPIDINAADCSLLNIETRDVTGQAVDFIVTDANAVRLRISGWLHRGDSGAGADTAISMVGGDDAIIESFQLYGNFAVAAIENVTTAANRVRIGGGDSPNYIWTENAADVAITMVAATTGHIGPNLYLMLQDNAANFSGATVGAAMNFFKPIQIVNLAGESSADTTITASTNA